MARQHDLAEIERAMDTLEATKSLVGAKAVRPALAVLRKREREARTREWMRLTAAGEAASAAFWHAVVKHLGEEKIRLALKEGRTLSRYEAQSAAATAITDAMRRCVAGDGASQMRFLWELRDASGPADNWEGSESDPTEADAEGDDGGPE